MIRVLACMLSFLFIQQLHAQQVYYIYIQSENRKPFYARMNNKVVSSTASGYLLLPKLQNGGYRAAIGFPGKTGEEEFLFTIDNADQGFDLKETPGDNGAHVLFNLLTYKMENPVAAGTEPKKDAATGNGFGDLLAEAVKDPSVKNIEPVKKADPPKPVEQPKVKEEPAVAPPDTKTNPVVAPPDTMMIKSKPVEQPAVVKEEKKEEPVKPVVEEPQAKPAPPVITGSVSTIYRKAGNDGTDLVVADRTNGSNDTIRIFIPRLTSYKAVAENPPPVVEQPKEKEFPPVADVPANKEATPVLKEEKKEEPPVIKPEPVKQPETVKTIPSAETKKDEKFLDIELKNPNSGKTPPDTLTIAKPDTVAAPRKLVMVNTDCKKIAEESDFIKLRTKMAGEKSNEEMISVAVKEFRKKCYTSEHIKSLSVLITGDDGKYRFYEVAYPFVYDSNNYPALENQLTDTYFINRFKALVRKN